MVGQQPEGAIFRRVQRRHGDPLVLEVVHAGDAGIGADEQLVKVGIQDCDQRDVLATDRVGLNQSQIQLAFSQQLDVVGRSRGRDEANVEPRIRCA